MHVVAMGSWSDDVEEQSKIINTLQFSVNTFLTAASPP